MHDLEKIRKDFRRGKSSEQPEPRLTARKYTGRPQGKITAEGAGTIRQPQGKRQPCVRRSGLCRPDVPDRLRPMNRDVEKRHGRTQKRPPSGQEGGR